MRLTRIRLAATVAAFLLGPASLAFGEPPAWPEEPHVQELMAWALPETSPGGDGRDFARRGTRAATYTAAGLLWRDGPHDRAAAAAILRGVLDLQYADGPDSTLYGVWRRHLGETVHDSNWREFIGCGLILIVETFPGRFVRANGMDMTQYFALTGLWIALVVGDPARTPIPASRAPRGVRIFGPVFALLQPQVPEDVLPHLRVFPVRADSNVLPASRWRPC